jgi:hypothetical protein
MDAAGAGISKRNALVCAAWLCGAVACALPPVGQAQAGNTEPIRVESHRVLVPVFVVDKNRRVLNAAMPDLTLNNFQLSEDGMEQKIESVAVDRTHIWEVLDTPGVHVNTPIRRAASGAQRIYRSQGSLEFPAPHST